MAQTQARRIYIVKTIKVTELVYDSTIHDEERMDVPLVALTGAMDNDLQEQLGDGQWCDVKIVRTELVTEEVRN